MISVNDDVLNNTELLSPRYPQNYPSFTDCTYHISSATNTPYAVHFEVFNLQDGVDFLYINSTNSYTGSTIPLDFTSDGSDIDIRFYSDGSVNEQGYRIVFRPAGNSHLYSF